MDHLINNPFRTADHSIECPECSSIFTWNTEDGLTGQTCGCGHVFTEDDAERQTIDITPEGCKTPEGRKRVADAQREWDSVTHELANVLKEFVDLGVTLCEKRGNGFVPDFDAISQIQNLIGARDRKQEAFLRAVSGAPEAPVKPKLKTYPANVNGKQVMVTIPED